jgi:putative membrane-bound dehydrogenase-like protein
MTDRRGRGTLRSAVMVLAMLVTISRAQEPAGQDLRIPPREPAEARKTFRLRDGFTLDLLAAEPLVTDPVAMEYDEKGRAYVAEMRDYPYTDKSTDQPFRERATDLPLGRIRILEDADGDGTFDRSTIFADGLSWPTGLALWKGGVYVAATPDLLYLKDTDGDGRADVRRKVFTGFHKFNIQAVINNLRWGLDHKIYGAGSSNGGLIRRGENGSEPAVRMGASDFRFDPESEQFELISGGARFGQAFDDWGRRFLCNIRNPIRHAVIEDRYVARNPLLPAASLLEDVAESGDTLPIYRISRPEPWRVLSAARLAADPARLSPRSETVGAGYVTAACGLTIYRGSAYPPEYYGQAFLGEVAANVIHRQKLRPDGLSFRSVRVDRDLEFAASTDNWFRPVNFTNAPDGTLHVLDMYRETIEHPWSIPDDIKARLDLESGRDRGRIYRLSPPGFKPRKVPRLGSASVGEVIAALEHPDSWPRETAHRLIFERQDRGSVGPLRTLLRKSSSDPAARPHVASLGRLHALWSLQGLNALSDEDLRLALGDPHPGVREHAIRLAETRLGEAPRLLERVLELAEDPDVRVRGQAALSLGGLADERATRAIASIAARDPADKWVRLAVLSARPDRAVDLVEVLVRGESVPPEVLCQLANMVGKRNRDDELRRVLKAVAPGAADRTSTRRELIAGLSEGLTKHNASLSETARRVEPASLEWIEGLVRVASTLALDSTAPSADRVQCIRLVGMVSYDRARETLGSLLSPRTPQEVQLAAIEALARHARPELPPLLLEAARGATPAVRAEIVYRLLGRKEWIPAVLAAIAERSLTPSDIPQARRAMLLRNPDPAIRSRAESLLASEPAGARSEVVKRYRPALALAADAGRGREVARRVCFACHRLGGEGNDAGPALETIRNRSAEEVLLHVLDPNREVSPSYYEYVCVLKDGRVTTGAIASESPSAVSFRRAGGTLETIQRDDIDELKSTGKSMMPEGIENQVSVQEMADLLAYLLPKD